MPINDGQLLRPSDEPILAPVVFDWDLSLTEALMNRAELRRQKWLIEQRQLQLIAARNFLKPDLDVFGRYRWRGLGESLIDPDGGGPRFDDAFDTLVSGDFQEWQLGVELSIPIGNRRAHAGVRNAEFRLVREQALLKEQEFRITRDVSDAFAEVARAYEIAQIVYKRREAARDQRDALQTAYSRDNAPLNLLLDAQRRLALAESRYYEATIEYTIAIKNMQFAKGSLLEYSGVHLAEGPWSQAASEDAVDRRNRRTPIRHERLTPDHRVISSGPSSGHATMIAPPAR
jgi:outer membrane protein TolC